MHSLQGGNRNSTMVEPPLVHGGFVEIGCAEEVVADYY